MVGFFLQRQTDGKVMVGGQFQSVNGGWRPGFARLEDDGRLDEGFAAAWRGPGPSGPVQAIAVQPDGKTIAVGGFHYIGRTLRPHVARFNRDGSFDASFAAGLGGAELEAVTPPVDCVAVQPDGKILVGGAFSVFQGVPAGKIVRLNRDGSIDPTFLNGMTGANRIVRAMRWTDFAGHEILN